MGIKESMPKKRKRKVSENRNKLTRFLLFGATVIKLNGIFSL
jgi:hypothetical protein